MPFAGAARLLLAAASAHFFIPMQTPSCTLLVDDDETTNYLNQKLLEKLGVAEQLLVAYNGQHHRLLWLCFGRSDCDLPVFARWRGLQ